MHNLFSLKNRKKGCRHESRSKVLHKIREYKKAGRGYCRSCWSRGKVVNFSTAALIKSTYKQVGKLLAKKGIVQAEEEFYCKGSFGVMHKGKPDEKDCKAAAAFAKKSYLDKLCSIKTI